ncbi:MAG: GIY-YIG nuclease family protein [Chitinispirillaceae bacterium]
MNLGRAVSLYLLDGKPDGVIICEMFNWVGMGIKIPKKSLHSVFRNRELRAPGVFLLIGRDEDSGDAVWIGNSENVLKQLLSHRDKDFWTEALVFTSSSQNLRKTNLKFLEYILYKQALRSSKYNVLNTAVPAKPSVPVSEAAAMREFFENIRIIIGTMGYRVFHQDNKSRIVSSAQREYIASLRKEAVAAGLVTPEGFVVLKGAKVTAEESESLPERIRRKRKLLIKEKIIADWKFTRDYVFPSPVVASAVLTGHASDKLYEWQKRDGSRPRRLGSQLNLKTARRYSETLV